MSRLIDTLAADAPAALAAINTARAAVQGRVWNLAGTDAPDHQATASDPLIIDLDATLITAHSEKDWQQRLSSVVSVTTRSERGLTTAPVAPANPSRCSSGKATPGRTPPLITSRSPRPHCGDCRPPTRLGDQGRRSSSAPMAPAAPNEFLNWLTTQRLTYSVGFTLTLDMAAKLETIPTSAWTPANDADRRPRDGAWVTELTRLLDLSGWPDGMGHRPRRTTHPGAQLRFTDIDDNRLTAFVTNITRGQLPDLELRHRRRPGARTESATQNTPA